MTSALPTVSAALVLDAQTQPGWTLAPLIEVKGVNLSEVMTMSGGNSTLRGLVINRDAGYIGALLLLQMAGNRWALRQAGGSSQVAQVSSICRMSPSRTDRKSVV